MVDIDINYTGGLRCRAVHVPSGNALLTDAPVDNKGKGETFSPTDLVATAFGACMATIMGIVADEEKIDLTGMDVHVVKEMTSTPPRRIARLVTRVTMPCVLTAEQKARFESAAKVCPVAQSLHPGVETPIEFVYPC
jgi:putative redox protein